MFGRGRLRRRIVGASVVVGNSNYPQDVADLGYFVAQWDASALDTLFQDTGKTTPVSSNGDLIGCWTDRIGGIDATTAARPTWNGVDNSVYFDGTRRLSTASTFALTTHTMFVVYRATNGNVIIQHRDASNNLTQISNGGQTADWYVTDSGSRSSYNWAGVQTDTITLACMEYNDTHASHKTYINGSEQSYAATNTQDTTYTVTGNFYIGDNRVETSKLAGNIYEIVVCDYLPSGLRASMQSYLNDKWSVY